jgi:hypothetical protein
MAIYALFSIASGLIKMSILLFYRRLSTRTVSSAYRWTLRVTIASIGLSTGKSASLLCSWSFVGEHTADTNNSHLHIRQHLHVQSRLGLLGPRRHCAADERGRVPVRVHERRRRDCGEWHCLDDTGTSHAHWTKIIRSVSNVQAGLHRSISSRSALL